ncbi:MAG: hypothetical protein HFH84_14870 [Lachnospiraceae bacterium]|nr:hypothetical protein [Lachnospiraceae bacterium]
MKRNISRTFFAMLLCAILLPIRANAAGRDGFQLDNKGVVTLLSQHAAKEKISTLQFSLSVNTAGVNTVEFQFAENRARIAEYRYDKEKSQLNIYLAGVEPLFAEGTNELRIGKIVVLDPNRNEAGAEIGVVMGTLGYVYGTEMRLEEDVDLPEIVSIGPSAQVTPAPTQEPSEPAEPTDEPAQPTDEPAGPTEEPTGPTQEPSGPTDEPAQPTETPVNPGTPGDGPGKWVTEADGNQYWYEGGVKQGTEGRGKEIYDPASDAWYWLDAVDGGRKAVSKDVYMESAAGPLAENADGTGKWVRYDANGHMVKGWDRTEAGTWYFDPIFGTMAKGYVVIGGELFRFDKISGIGSGQPCEWREVFGWVVEEDGNRYWYEDGVKQGTEGRGKEIYDPDSDAWYWLDAVDGGKKAVSKDVYMESLAGGWAENADGTGKWVRYDANGHMVKEWDTTEAGTYYFDPVFGTMAKGTVFIEGSEYRFDPITGIQIGKRNRRPDPGQKN